jgi:hypothetical protein
MGRLQGKSEVLRATKEIFALSLGFYNEFTWVTVADWH